MKKLLVVLAAAVLAMVMAVPAFAEGESGHTISVSEGDTHTYKVFQVLTGTLSEEGSTALGNPAWGADAIANPGSVNDFIESITADDLSDAQIAKLVYKKANLTKEGVPTVSAGSPLSGLATGYYVLVDVTDPLSATETKSLNVVKVVNDIEGFTIKYDTTSDDKIITTDTLGTGDPNVINGKVDNVSIGDTVNYRITAKIPAKATDYNYFYFIINDTLDPGLTFTEGSIKVYKDSVAEENLLTLGAENDYQVKYAPNADGKTFEVGLNNAKLLAGKDIIVTYSAVLNENAQIGETPNKNTSTVTFSNDPNHDYNGDPENPSPGFPASQDTSVLGETPVTTTQTFTTGIQIKKEDEEGNVLTGAEFTITGDSVQTVLVSEEAFVEAENGEYYKLKDGTYTKEAPKADEMIEAPEGAEAGYVEDASYNGEDKIVVNGVTYRPYTADDDGATVYILQNGSSSLYDNPEQKYEKTVTYTAKDTTAQDVSATAEVDEKGIVTFKGLGAGTYTITESKTPDGYNTIEDFKIEIAFTANPEGDDAVHWSKVTTSESDAKYDYDSTDGVFKITVVNNKGAELPSTGGMGTTILYVVGAILVVGAGVFLIVRRRVSKESNVETTQES